MKQKFKVLTYKGIPVSPYHLSPPRIPDRPFLYPLDQNIEGQMKIAISNHWPKDQIDTLKECYYKVCEVNYSPHNYFMDSIRFIKRIYFKFLSYFR